MNGPVAPFLRMASKKIPNLVGVKYSHSDLSDLLECTILDNGRFEVLYGCDEMLLGAIAMGVRGAVGSTYNFAASIYLEMMEAFEKGDVENKSDAGKECCDCSVDSRVRWHTWRQSVDGCFRS